MPEKPKTRKQKATISLEELERLFKQQAEQIGRLTTAAMKQTDFNKAIVADLNKLSGRLEGQENMIFNAIRGKGPVGEIGQG